MTVTWLWQHSSITTSCWQRGQRDLSDASGVIISICKWHLLCHADLILTHCCSWCLMMKLPSALPQTRPCDQRDLQHFVFICLCYGLRTVWLDCWAGLKLISLPLIPLVIKSNLWDSMGRVTYTAFGLIWELCQCTVGVSTAGLCTSYKYKINLLVLVLWNVWELKLFCVYTCFSFAWQDRKASGSNWNSIKDSNLKLLPPASSSETLKCRDIDAVFSLFTLSWRYLAWLSQSTDIIFNSGISHQ